MNTITLLEEKIKGANLTETQKRIANYFLENINEVSLKTATKLAYELDTSDTSIIRFVRKLGYNSYLDFQRDMKEVMVKQINISANLMSPAKKYQNTIEKLSQNDLINNLMAQTFKNLERTFDMITYETVNEIANVLIASNQKYILGFRGSASLADFISGKLRYLLPNINLCTHADSELFEKLIDITENDCILIYSFPIYTKLCISAIEIAREKNAKIIVVTDKITSPIAAKADFTITTAVDGLGFSNSYVAPLCLNDLILLTVCQKSKDFAKDRINNLEKHLEIHNIH